MNILAIDFSLTNCAYVLTTGDTITDYGSVQTKPDKLIKDMTVSTYFRVRIIANHILSKVTAKPDILAIESPSLMSKGNAAITMPMGNGMLVATLMEKLDTPHLVTVTPRGLKTFATNKGNCSKQEMLDALEKDNRDFHNVLVKLPKAKGRYDICDAYWIAKYFSK